MKKNLVTLATVLTIGFFTNNVMAQQTSATVSSATANARLVQVMTLVETAQLDFGTILLGTSGAEKITLNPSSDALTGGINHKPSSTTGKPATAGLYTVTGTKNAVYFVTLPISGKITVTTGLATADETMVIDALQLKFNNTNNGSATSTTNKLTNLGKDTFSLGGDLNIGATQLEGVYTGTYTVSVDYN